MSEEKPFVAFVLCLLGGIFMMIGKLLLFDRGIIIINIIVSMILGTLVIIGALLIYTDRVQNIKTGGLIVLTTAMVSLFTISDRYHGYEYGYFLGFLGGVLLSIIGSIFALAWKPKLTVAQRNP
jgi:hypothetical protein